MPRRVRYLCAIAIALAGGVFPALFSIDAHSLQSSSRSPIFDMAALAPPVDAADFRAHTYDLGGHVRVVQQAEETLARSDASDASGVSTRTGRPPEFPYPSFPKRRWQQVDDVIRHTVDADDATRLLRSELGWRTTERNLLAYMKRFALSTSWRRFDVVEWLRAGEARAGRPRTRPVTPPRRQRRILDPQQIPERILRSLNADHAVELLHHELGWWPSLSGLYAYMRRHDLRAPHWTSA